MGFGNNWKTMARHFEQNFHILLFDQRGHGRSFKPKEGYAPSNFANDLKLILDELAWPRVTLVGHSMGARVAVQFAADHPERVDKLILVDMGPVSDLAGMLRTEEKIRFVPVPFKNRDEARAFFDGPFLEKFKNEVVKQFFYANLDQDAQGQMNWRFFLPGIFEILWQSRVGNQWAQFKALQVPTLLVRGRLSTDLQPEVYEKVLAENPHIQGVVVEGAGHWVHVEKPEELHEIFKGFLQ
jgi:pimeloyl-ACP methyl ester carboxylesterase